MRTLVLASGNAGKLRELRDILGGSFEVRAQAEFGVEDIEETGLTFVENALLKARHAAQATGLPALADDSGLCVDALGGAPGLYSARYAGTHGDARANISKLLAALRDVPDEHRIAHFHASIVLLRHATDPQPLICEGRWEGQIMRELRGTNGFGYNPVFLDTTHGLTAAEMEPALKNAISHRAIALQQLKQQLAAWL